MVCGASAVDTLSSPAAPATLATSSARTGQARRPAQSRLPAGNRISANTYATPPMPCNSAECHHPICVPLIAAIASMAVCAWRLNAPAAPSIPMTRKRTVQSRRASPNRIAANSRFTPLNT